MTLGYRIREGGVGEDNGLVQYANSAISPRRLIELLATQKLNAFTASRTIEELLTDPEANSSDVLLTGLQAAADDKRLGIEIVDASITAVRPPTNAEVAAAYMTQVAVRQEVEATLESAETDAIATLAEVAGSREQALEIDEAIGVLEQMRRDGETAEAIAAQEATIESLLESAGGEAARRLQQARAYRWQQGLTEQARADGFAAQRAAFEAAPAYFRARLLLEASSEAMAGSRKIVIDAGVDSPTLRLDLKDVTGAFQGIFAE